MVYNITQYKYIFRIRRVKPVRGERKELVASSSVVLSAEAVRYVTKTMTTTWPTGYYCYYYCLYAPRTRFKRTVVQKAFRVQ